MWKARDGRESFRRDYSASSLFLECHVDHYKVIHRKLAFSLCRRVLESDNEIVSAIACSVFFITSQIYDKWSQILYL